jgi:hypothetical protein
MNHENVEIEDFLDNSQLHVLSNTNLNSLELDEKAAVIAREDLAVSQILEEVKEVKELKKPLKIEPIISAKETSFRLKILQKAAAKLSEDEQNSQKKPRKLRKRDRSNNPPTDKREEPPKPKNNEEKDSEEQLNLEQPEITTGETISEVLKFFQEEESIDHEALLAIGPQWTEMILSENELLESDMDSKLIKPKFAEGAAIPNSIAIDDSKSEEVKLVVEQAQDFRKFFKKEATRSNSEVDEYPHHDDTSVQVEAIAEVHFPPSTLEMTVNLEDLLKDDPYQELKSEILDQLGSNSEVLESIEPERKKAKLKKLTKKKRPKKLKASPVIDPLESEVVLPIVPVIKTGPSKDNERVNLGDTVIKKLLKTHGINDLREDGATPNAKKKERLPVIRQKSIVATLLDKPELIEKAENHIITKHPSLGEEGFKVRLPSRRASAVPRIKSRSNIPNFTIPDLNVLECSSDSLSISSRHSIVERAPSLVIPRESTNSPMQAHIKEPNISSLQPVAEIIEDAKKENEILVN